MDAVCAADFHSYSLMPPPVNSSEFFLSLKYKTANEKAFCYFFDPYFPDRLQWR